MTELIASIKDNGVLVPGVARPRPQGGYEIISGHCRKYACEMAGLFDLTVNDIMDLARRIFCKALLRKRRVHV